MYFINLTLCYFFHLLLRAAVHKLLSRNWIVQGFQDCRNQSNGVATMRQLDRLILFVKCKCNYILTRKRHKMNLMHGEKMT